MAYEPYDELCTRSPHGRVRVLVAETDRHLRLVLCWVLGEDLRFKVVARAASAAEVDACEAIFDVALLDLLLAGSHGLDLIERLRHRVPRSLVVVLAETVPVYLRHALDAAGAAGILLNPGDLDHLADRLHDLVRTTPTTPLDARIS